VTDRAQLGWRVPADVIERFEDYVHEKHGSHGPYVRFELECAMREYLDDDELLVETEDLLRDHLDLRGFSSSTALSTRQYRGTTTTQVGYRVNAALKERFQAFADEHNADTYGRALAAALESYADGGRAKRLLTGVTRLITGDTDSGTTSGTTAGSVENDHRGQTDSTATLSTATASGTTSGTTDETSGEAEGSSDGATCDSVSVDAQAVLEIADELPADIIPNKLLEARILETAPANDADTIRSHREAVLQQIDAEPHPHRDGVYITTEHRENSIIWADLDKAERLVLLRRFAAHDAMDNRQRRRAYDYRDVTQLFREEAGGGGPSHQYAYDLMKAAADEDGFEYKQIRGQKQLRVDLNEVRDEILEYACDLNPGVALVDLGVDTELSSFGAGAAPEQEGAADD
jgi:hypothetical protein